MLRSVLTVLGLLPLAAAALPLGLNDTGLALCGNAEAADLPCTAKVPPGQDPRFGRDAMARAGVLYKVGHSAGVDGFDYTKVSRDGRDLPPDAALGPGAGDWACSRDNVTGLLWEVKTDDGGLQDKDWLFAWHDIGPNGQMQAGQAADDFGRPLDVCNNRVQPCDTLAYRTAINQQGLCGRDNWRLPGRQELQSLVHYGRQNPAIDPQFFPNSVPVYPVNLPPMQTVSPKHYWTQQRHLRDGTVAYAIDVNDGHGVMTGFLPNIIGPVRLVSGGEAGQGEVRRLGKWQTCGNWIEASTPTADFIDHGDGTLTHRRTGLMWPRCMIGETWRNGECVGQRLQLGWPEALQAVEPINAQGLAGHRDWRMPNRAELFTVGEQQCDYPSANLELFPSHPGGDLWTSSMYPGRPQHAAMVYFDALYTGFYKKTHKFPFLLVRGGGAASFDAEKDYSPDAFDPGRALAAAGEWAAAEFTVKGLGTVTGIKIDGGEYAVNGGAFGTRPAVVGNGDRVQVRARAGQTATLTIGGVRGQLRTEVRP